ncbi:MULTISPECIES: TerB family tellurite resistance protein [unclassified Halomonas]|uniref:tellurite resistance TerB family protein n=1 Tax=unclassified Halomonas TaxID=2609666 RepID=UPI000E5A4E8A|nr:MULTISPECIES: TerB family tellurite resistance protein [unclassified Halomonas]AXY43319.1 TerB family tellurite resistance protein [Halomonas sp. JS92-SW72]QJQ98944.1 TerB family tellurite resistance protein [Halomonas sp. PGE1]
MLADIQRFFQQVLADPEARDDKAPTLELATAALLCEVMRADYQEDPAQLVALREMLRGRFALEDEAVDELVDLAREEVESSVDHYQFVSLIKQHYDYPKRCELVRMMWDLALADGEHHHLEEHRIRQLADLLHVGHGDFIRAKLQSRGERA